MAPDQPPGSNCALRQTNWTELRRSWRSSDLFDAQWFLKGTPTEKGLFVPTHAGGNGTFVGLYVVYRPATLRSSSTWEIQRHGGISVGAQLLTAGTTGPGSGAFWARTKTVRVRGDQIAYYFEAGHGQGSNPNDRLREVTWEVAARDQSGAHVQYSVVVDPSQYSLQQQVELIDHLTVVHTD